MTKSQKKKIQGNIWKFAIFSITNKRTYMTFMTIFLLTMPSATAKTIGVMTAVGQIVGFLLEIPSGYISDKIGHRNALILARIFLVLSTACFVFANSVPWFFAATIFLSFGSAFSSGTTGAFMHDTLKRLGKDNQYAKIMGRIKSLGFAIPIIFIVTLPMIAETDFRLAFVVALAIDIIGLVFTLLMTDPNKHTKIEEVGVGNLRKTLQNWSKVGWVRFVIINSLISGIIFGATAGFKNPYQEMVGFSIASLGFLWGASRVFISILLLANGWIHKKLSFKQFIIMKTFVYSICFIIIGLISNMWVVASMFILQNTFSLGLGSASSQYNLKFIKKSKSKATLLSVNQLLNKVVVSIFSVTMGFMVAGYSFPFAFMIIGLILLLVGFFASRFLPNK